VWKIRALSPTTPLPEPTPPRRWLPLAVLLAGLAAFLALGVDDYLSFEALARHRAELIARIEAHPILAPLVYIAGYVVAIACSLPGGVILTLTGGFLFGPVFGALFAIVGATGGATTVFLAAKRALGGRMRPREGTVFQRMQDGFRRDAFSYLVLVRIVPLFPFFLVNLVPALAGVPTRTFLWATFVGLIPGAFVFASVGNGLGAVFDAGQTPELRMLTRPPILLPLIGLGLLALLPIGYRHWKGRAGD
jgi:uncharacterized membrane protein YdjX (TVP38/TMEM64 family)